MSRRYDYDEERYRWEREHDYALVWKCPQCDYKYESEPSVNEAMPCPICGCRTEQAGESYIG